MNDMDLSFLVPITVSVVGAIASAIYARRRGLPEVRAEIDQASKDLIALLKDQLVLANADVAKLRPMLAAATTQIIELEETLERKEQRIVQLIIRIDELERKIKNGSHG